MYLLMRFRTCCPWVSVLSYGHFSAAVCASLSLESPGKYRHSNFNKPGLTPYKFLPSCQSWLSFHFTRQLYSWNRSVIIWNNKLCTELLYPLKTVRLSLLRRDTHRCETAFVCQTTNLLHSSHERRGAVTVYAATKWSENKTKEQSNGTTAKRCSVLKNKIDTCLKPEVWNVTEGGDMAQYRHTVTLTAFFTV
jgi:hypothetical protein